jgi:hypothetical protein
MLHSERLDESDADGSVVGPRKWDSDTTNPEWPASQPACRAQRLGLQCLLMPCPRVLGLVGGSQIGDGHGFAGGTVPSAQRRGLWAVTHTVRAGRTSSQNKTEPESQGYTEVKALGWVR